MRSKLFKKNIAGVFTQNSLLKSHENMPKNNSLISIVIPTANRLSQLQRLLVSVKKASYKNYEIIVVNDSSKKLANILKTQRVKVIENGDNKGLAYSRTKGANLAKGKYVLFIDDDNVIEKQMISGLVRSLEFNKNLIAVGPLTYYLSNKKKIAFLGVTIHLGTSQTTFATSFEKSKLMDNNLFVTNNLHNCFMIRRNLGEKVGWFDSQVFMSGTEFDMFQRMRKFQRSGILATNVEASCYHDVLDITGNRIDNFVANYATRPKRIYYYQRNKGLLASRYGSIFDKLSLGLIWYPVYMLIYGFIFLKGKNIKLFLQNIRGGIAGYKYLLS